MADAPPQMNADIPQDDKLAPPLEQARSLFTTPASAEWSDGIIAKIQQHTNAIDAADANAATGQQFVQTIADTKSNLVEGAKSDPTSTGFYIGLAPELLNGSLSHMNPEDGAAAHASLTTHFQHEIAVAGITSMANTHGGAARQLLDTLDPHLAEGDRDALTHYIDAMDAAREADHGAQATQMDTQQARASALAAYQHSNGLLNQTTDQVQFPPDYMSRLVSRGDISPQDKHALYTGYNNLRTYGDPPTSDPHLLTSMLDNLDNVQHTDIMGQVGTGLKYADAQVLHAFTTTQTPDMQHASRQLADVMLSARDELTARGDRAGDAAFGRFSDWLMASYRRTGPSGLNPSADNYLFATATPGMFQARHSDIVPPSRPSVPLSSIFASATPGRFHADTEEVPEEGRTSFPRGRQANERADPGMEGVRVPGTGDKSAVDITQDDEIGSPFLGGEGGADLGGGDGRNI